MMKLMPRFTSLLIFCLMLGCTRGGLDWSHASDPSFTPDPSFGANGRATLRVGDGETSLRALAEQEDGKILAAGETTIGGLVRGCVARLNADGSVDTGFGNQGVFVLRARAIEYSFLTAIFLQSDGAIVAGGFRCENCTTVDRYDTFFVRLTPAGQLDTSFGTQGTKAIDMSLDSMGQFGGARQEQMTTGLPLSTGGALGFGFITKVNGVSVPAIFAFNRSFEREAGYHGGGMRTIDFGPPSTEGILQGAAQHPDGGLVAGGRDSSTQVSLLVARYGADGAAIPFGSGGAVRLVPGTTDRCFLGISVDVDGSIVGVAFINAILSDGNTEARTLYLVRLDSTGNLVSSFSDDGSLELRIPGYKHTTPRGLAILPGSRKILVIGTVHSALPLTAGSSSQFLALFYPDGTLDSKFGAGGIAVDDKDLGYTVARTLLPLRKSGLLVGGETQDSSGPGIFLVTKY